MSECSICLEEIRLYDEVVRCNERKCGKRWHSECVTKWINSSNRRHCLWPGCSGKYPSTIFTSAEGIESCVMMTLAVRGLAFLSRRPNWQFQLPFMAVMFFGVFKNNRFITGLAGLLGVAVGRLFYPLFVNNLRPRLVWKLHERRLRVLGISPEDSLTNIPCYKLTGRESSGYTSCPDCFELYYKTGGCNRVMCSLCPRAFCAHCLCRRCPVRMGEFHWEFTNGR